MNVEKSDLDHSPSYGGGSTGSPLPVLASLVVIVFGLRWFSEQLAPIALGFILTIAITPLYTWLRGRGWPSWGALTATLAAGYGILLALVGSIVWSGYEMIRLFGRDEYSEGLSNLQDDIGRWLQDLGVREGAVRDAVNNLDVSSVIGHLGSALSGVLGVASAVGLIVLVMFFAVPDGPRFTRIIDTLARKQPYLNAGFDLYVTRTRSYLLVSTVFGAIVAVLDGLALWIMGIPLVGVWVVLSFVTNYIPNVGFVIGVIPPALVALIGYDVNRMIWVIVIYCALNFVIQSLIQPRIVGDSVGLSTSLTFLSLVFWSFVIGPLGSVLAIPLTLFAKALLVDINPRLQWIRPLLSLDEDQPVSVIDEARLAREDPLQLTRDDPAASTSQDSPQTD
ncbi:MAG: AI-2E family transporter [Acidimicrobiia bacterium]|nr:AI-2E family transporter [Acidimicrobiia bacterium]